MLNLTHLMTVPSRLIQLSVNGLFFRPMHQRRLTTLSNIKAWDHYMKIGFKEKNVEASSPSSYFGLNPIAFAVRYLVPNIYDHCIIMISHLKSRP